MKTQQLDLQRRLEREGWRVIERDRSTDWWAAEVWTIESTWRPLGCLLWITFLVDPQYDGVEKQAHVWAVGATSSAPSSRHDVEPSAVLIRHGWDTHLDALVRHITELRDDLGR